MQRLLRTLVAVPILAALILTASFAALSFAQQADAPKAAAAKKQPATPPGQSAEKPAENPAKPEAPPESRAAMHESPGDRDKDKEEHYDMAEMPPMVTHHQITVDGKLLKYTATTGRLPIKRGDGKIEAEMFYVAYTLDGQDAAKRPLTFAFNGGPGSASIWLHMGALGPRKVVLRPDGFMPPAPYRMEDNPHTLLDKSDLVLIDAIGTGFSRAADAELFKKFWGVKGDIEAFSEFIRLYITPQRALVVAAVSLRRKLWHDALGGHCRISCGPWHLVQRHHAAVDRAELRNSRRQCTNDQPYIFLIPSFTMIAGYHHKLPPDLAQDMNKARQEAEQWASSEYAHALDKGDSLTPDERQKVIDQMARFTGLSKEVIDEANLRINVPQVHALSAD